MLLIRRNKSQINEDKRPFSCSMGALSLYFLKNIIMGWVGSLMLNLDVLQASYLCIRNSNLSIFCVYLPTAILRFNNKKRYIKCVITIKSNVLK
uniref:Uncharacterized protein n=1 Tax=Meloidogyne enterolobii TaxID=390850 RepID=A0A6V7VKP9_MELEN|nr:unnamed protein product [Meloidogyne enterolobii]